MINLAVAILWFALGVMILGGIIYVALWAIKQAGIPLPGRVETFVWAAFVILVLIYLLLAISGQAPFPNHGLLK